MLFDLSPNSYNWFRVFIFEPVCRDRVWQNTFMHDGARTQPVWVPCKGEGGMFCPAMVRCVIVSYNVTSTCKVQCLASVSESWRPVSCFYESLYDVTLLMFTSSHLLGHLLYKRELQNYYFSYITIIVLNVKTLMFTCILFFLHRRADSGPPPTLPISIQALLPHPPGLARRPVPDMLGRRLQAFQRGVQCGFLFIQHIVVTVVWYLHLLMLIMSCRVYSCYILCCMYEGYINGFIVWPPVFVLCLCSHCPVATSTAPLRRLAGWSTGTRTDIQTSYHVSDGIVIGIHFATIKPT